MSNVLLKTIILAFILIIIQFNKIAAQDKSDTALINQNINSIIDSVTSNPEFAQTLALHNLKLSEQANYPWGIFMSNLSLGTLAYNNGQPKAAIKFHEATLKYGRKHGFKQKEAIVLSNLAKDYNGAGESEKAINLYHEAIKVATSINEPLQVAYSLQGLGQLYSGIGFPNEAIQYCSQAANIFLLHKNYAKLRYAYSNIAAASMDLSKYDSAYKYLWLSKNAYDASGNQAPQLDFYLNMAITCDSLSLTDSTVFYYEQTIKAAQSLNDESALAAALNFLAIKEASLGNSNKAIRLFKDALSHSEKFKNLEGCISIANSLSKLYAQIGAYDNAYVYAKKEIEYTNAFLGQEKVKTINALNVKFEKQQLQNAFDKKIARQNLLLYGLIILAVLLGIIIFVVINNFKQKSIITKNKNEQLKQKLLLTQMNPHFIFNSVDNIQSLIYSHKEEEAINYLTKFSKLTRQILENSTQNLISLEEELQMIDNYLNIQKLLYNNNFTHKIIIEEDIVPETILLPPMLTQPFIENAIKHGLKHKKEGGLILVRFYMTNEQLFFEVEDNGTGIIEKEVVEGHKSLSTLITKERLKSIANKKKITIHSDNILDDFKNVLGVKTFFEIPYQLNF